MDFDLDAKQLTMTNKSESVLAYSTAIPKEKQHDQGNKVKNL